LERDSVFPGPFQCGHCGTKGVPSQSFILLRPDGTGQAGRPLTCMLICPACFKPTHISDWSNGRPTRQIPGILVGDDVQHLPPDVEAVYGEARKAMTVEAYTGAAHLCRKILMNVAVSQGAKEKETFQVYVDYLEQNHYFPKGSMKWVDHIRHKGNDAAHHLGPVSKADAVELINFVDVLLKQVFEFPALMQAKKT